MTNFIATYSQGAENAGTQIDAVNIVAAYKTDLLIKFFTAAVLDCINSFGVEWGFRAYLLPKLYRKFGVIPAVLLSGFASGLWYAPLVAVGLYYGGGKCWISCSKHNCNVHFLAWLQELSTRFSACEQVVFSRQFLRTVQSIY